MKSGLFIVLEGSDGAGKATHLKLLAGRLRAMGHDIDLYDFPRYDHESSYFVRAYLNGKYGPASEISPYTASLFYALDRFEAAPQIKKSLKEGKIVLANRYVGSNMAHQGSKYSKEGEQRGFFVWADSLEYQLLGIPRPNLNVFLRVPAKTSFELIKRKQKRSYTDKSHDEHEADIEHLRKAVLAYDTLCRLFPKDFKTIESTKSGNLLPITEINNKIWDLIKPLLPPPKHAGRGSVINLDDSIVAKKAPETAINSSQNAPSGSDQKQLAVIRDVSLLAINNLLSFGAKLVERPPKWPANGTKPRLHYYIPSQFSPELAKKYHATMEKVAENYHQIEKLLNKMDNLSKADGNQNQKILEALVPLSALCDLSINDEKSINDLIKQGGLSDLPEIQHLADRLAKHKGPRQKVKEPEDIKKIIKQLADNRLTHYSAEDKNSLKLLESWPRNEFDLLVESLYPHSTLAKNDINAELDHWTYEQKAAALKSAYKQTDANTLEKAQYRFDFVGDRLLVSELVSSFSDIQIQFQPATPRYGYAVPEIIEKAGAENAFLDCFDLSLQLYSEIQAAGHENLAGYAALSGHRLRCQISMNASEIFKPYQKSSIKFKRLLTDLREKVAEVHPILADAGYNRLKIQANGKIRKTKISGGTNLRKA